MSLETFEAIVNTLSDTLSLYQCYSSDIVGKGCLIDVYKSQNSTSSSVLGRLGGRFCKVLIHIICVEFGAVMYPVFVVHRLYNPTTIQGS